MKTPGGEVRVPGGAKLTDLATAKGWTLHCSGELHRKQAERQRRDPKQAEARFLVGHCILWTFREIAPVF